jgi:hypothetical protein
MSCIAIEDCVPAGHAAHLNVLKMVCRRCIRSAAQELLVVTMTANWPLPGYTPLRKAEGNCDLRVLR